MTIAILIWALYRRCVFEDLRVWMRRLKELEGTDATRRPRSEAKVSTASTGLNIQPYWLFDAPNGVSPLVSPGLARPVVAPSFCLLYTIDLQQPTAHSGILCVHWHRIATAHANNPLPG
jgi:hypothetical protein